MIDCAAAKSLLRNPRNTRCEAASRPPVQNAADAAVDVRT
jgi:hypothetical protein